MHARLAQLARQPLVQFSLIGLVLFGVDRLLEEPELDERVRVTEETLDRFGQVLRERLDREPTREELEERVQGFVAHELLYREAQRLGLDQGDPIIRRRLIQKMQFLFEDAATLAEPTDEELSAFLVAHEEEFRVPDSMSFEHVYLSPARHEDVQLRALVALASLRAGDEPASLGDAFPLASHMADRSRPELERRFGEEFAISVFDAPEGSWSGPHRSNYGVHLVRATHFSRGRPARLAEVRAQVAGRWLEEQRSEAHARAIERLATRYGVDVAELPAEREVVAMADRSTR